MTAGFTPGSTPTRGMSDHSARNACTAAAVAVLQAITTPWHDSFAIRWWRYGVSGERSTKYSSHRSP
jgi:hypothetical protein